ncbi:MULTISPECIES: LuxR C-terminal-related transcriptional regulator [Sphingobium]|uniref:LuxR C-terminal-related transcriptional regulator n=1 Tax=Sphingobium TaxID=165695 RepID=UPI001BE9A57D|nr:MULTISPECIES: response regulator transcription factor [Sphingobium]MBT2246406.1 response regulator transcription factor [Sphingobium sp. BHU LFT2]WBQ19010.1 response regulator transcription factor [Sphingobium yanoikuyae]
MKDRAKILIIDDSLEMRNVLCGLLRKDQRFEVVEEGAECAHGIAMARYYAPDIAIVDCAPPVDTEPHYGSQLRQVVPSVYIAMFTLQLGKPAIASALSAGCRAYISKIDGPAVWSQAMDHALKGEPFFPGDASSFLVERMLDESEIPLRRLSPRQRQVVQQIAEGRRNTEIAEVLGMSVKTVEAHRLEAMQRLGLRNVAELVRYAIRHCIIEP